MGRSYLYGRVFGDEETTYTLWHSKKLDSFLLKSLDCERGFSLFNNLKNCSKSRLQAERLDRLIVISAKGSPLEEFPFECALMNGRQRNHK